MVLQSARWGPTRLRPPYAGAETGMQSLPQHHPGTQVYSVKNIFITKLSQPIKLLTDTSVYACVWTLTDS